MICGTAGGKLLSSMMVHKPQNLYKNLIEEGSIVTVYRHIKSGEFERWFLDVLLRARVNIQNCEQITVTGNKLSYHLSS